MRYLCTGWNSTGTSTIGKILRDKSQRYTTYNEAMFYLRGEVLEILDMNISVRLKLIANKSINIGR